MAEFDWIRTYFAPLADAPGAAGLADDVALLGDGSRVATVDALVEGVHFLASDPVDTVARKLVRVNVSDLLAKGCRPAEALLMLGWPKDRSEDALSRFAAALGEELEIWGARLVGGDTVTSPGGLFLSLTLLGVPEGPRAPVRRSGGQAGDRLWLTGRIGAGALGLASALAGQDDAARAAYRVPDLPPPGIAGLVARMATAAMDVSDGLLGDLAKLAAASGCGAWLDLARVPLFRPSTVLGEVMAQVTGGDDYQVLLAAAGGEDLSGAVAGCALTAIGGLEPGDGLRLLWEGKPAALPERLSFEHG